MIGGLRVIESLHLVEYDLAWLPLGRRGWKAKRRVKVPYRGAVRLNETTLVMHPAIVQQLRQQADIGGVR